MTEDEKNAIDKVLKWLGVDPASVKHVPVTGKFESILSQEILALYWDAIKTETKCRESFTKEELQMIDKLAGKLLHQLMYGVTEESRNNPLFPEDRV